MEQNSAENRTASPALCDEASAAMQEHGFGKQSCFAEYLFLQFREH